MPRLTVTLITLDEADRLPATLASIAWADEILVLDSGSTDATADIARAAGARVYVEPFRGYGPQKDRAAALAVHDWIFNLDADERPDEVLAAAVQALPASPPHAAYAVQRRNWIADHALRHWPWAGEWHARIYDRRRCRFGAQPIHESLLVGGALSRLPGVLEHASFRSWDDYFERQLRYARLWAAARPPRRVPALALALRAQHAFLKELLLKGRCLSGATGWRFARFSAHNVVAKYTLLDERARAAPPR